ncbi:MAG: hypothetical protein J3Q66DRAFT_384063 [Benniella sp.]|nr:MAG: hypothetical protein J3Q66DRAFT_384063 [Benniella sp.]
MEDEWPALGHSYLLVTGFPAAILCYMEMTMYTTIWNLRDRGIFTLVNTVPLELQHSRFALLNQEYLSEPVLVVVTLDDRTSWQAPGGSEYLWGTPERSQAPTL